MSWDKVRRAQMRWSVECEGCSVKCGAWRVQCEVWSVKCEVWTVKCEVWSVKCEVWTVKCEMWTVKCEVWTVKCEVWSVQWEACSVKCGVWSLKCGVWSVKCEVELQMWHVKQDTTFEECMHARAWLAHGACKFYRWERSYIPKATSALPRAGTTGTISWPWRIWMVKKVFRKRSTNLQGQKHQRIPDQSANRRLIRSPPERGMSETSYSQVGSLTFVRELDGDGSRCRWFVPKSVFRSLVASLGDPASADKQASLGCNAVDMSQTWGHLMSQDRRISWFIRTYKT